MKKVFLLFAALCICYFTYAQTVENISARPDGDNIRISYRIGGSNNLQTYNVLVECSMDGGARFTPKTLEGDYGANITGGKSTYIVIWDVFEDVDEVGDAEFFVKVDLVNDDSRVVNPVQNQQQKEPVEEPVKEVERTPDPFKQQDFKVENTPGGQVVWKAYLAYSGSIGSPIGISFGTLKNVGTYASFRYGSAIDDWQTDIWLTGIVGLTKYVLESGNYRLHAYAGAGITYEFFEDYTTYYTWSDTFLTIDFGVINAIGRLSLNLGLEYIRYTGTYPVFGIGFAF